MKLATPLLLLPLFVLGGPDTLRLEVEPLPISVRATIESSRNGPHVLVQPNYFTWCPSLVRTAEGKWYLVHSRWPTDKTFYAWLTFSEIAVAESESPEGPFDKVKSLIPAASSERVPWFNAHNPKLVRHADAWWLYFIQTRGASAMDETLRNEIAQRGGPHPLWKQQLRPNQRTFVASAPSLGGPWKVNPQPLLEPSGPITTLVVNPGVCARPDGSLLMIVKGDKPGETRFIRNQAVALAPHPSGPWVLQPRAVIDNLDTEDVSVWYDKKRARYYAVFHTLDDGGYIGMMTSDDGVAWSRAAQFRLTDKRLRFTDGTSYQPSMMERPFVVTDEQGSPTHLLVACGLGKTTGIVILKLRPC